MASELKAVLDSWVRYEQQVKENEQADLVKAILEKVNAGIKDEKVQKEILAAALAEVECETTVFVRVPVLISLSAREEQGGLDRVALPNRAKPCRRATVTRLFLSILFYHGL
jgi:Mitochondrial ATP synthase B chain precursor (ATP-synt_B)